MREYTKLGYQAPKGWGTKFFNNINIDGDLHYCDSHNFVYNKEHEEELLYNGKPNFYTDNRFDDSTMNFYGECYLFNGRYKQLRDRKLKPFKVLFKAKKKSERRKFHKLSLKACIRRVKKTKGIPVGTIVDFGTSWYYSRKKINTSYIYKVTKSNPISIDYGVTVKAYENNFNTCEFSNTLTNRLRESGFLVKVYNSNPDRLIGEHEGEIAIVHGFGKQIGYSSKNHPFRGYSDGCENILFDYFNEFDKWSRCINIPKTTSIDEIIEILKEPNTED